MRGNVKRINNFQQLFLFLIFIGLSTLFTILSPDFFSLVNISNMFRQQSMVAITAAGATFIMITTAIDISVGSTIALTGVVFALMAQTGMPLLPAALVAIAAGGVVGSVNACLVVGFKINPMISTLGSMYVFRGVAYLISDGTAVVNGLPDNFNRFGRGYVGPVPIPVLIMVLVYLVFHFVMKRTLLGKYTYSIGGNRETAQLSGIPVNKVMAAIYILTGMLAGLSGVIMASRLNSGNPQIAQGFEFDVIVAVFLGGVSTTGGEGSLIGTFIGAMIVGVLSNGLNLLGVNAFYQYIIKGCVLVIAVIIDMSIRRKRG